METRVGTRADKSLVVNEQSARFAALSIPEGTYVRGKSAVFEKVLGRCHKDARKASLATFQRSAEAFQSLLRKRFASNPNSER